MIEVYYFLTFASVILGMIMPQEGRRRKLYISIMTIMHTFICGFRYKFLTGDLIKYNNIYQNLRNIEWFSSDVLQEGKNVGFQILMKFVGMLTSGNFQFLLVLIAVIIEVVLAIMIYRYSPKPWLSYLIWNCIGFYIFGFSAIKQALAMAFVMCAMMAILEENQKKFIFWTCIAALMHAPAIAFLPAYWLARNKINFESVIGYSIAAVIIYSFRNQLVEYFGGMYYQEEAMELFQKNVDGLGGRFFMILLILACGILLRGFKEKNFQKVFNIIVVAAVFQMFSGFNNVFTRFADYYFQMSVLFIPMIFYDSSGTTAYNEKYMRALLPFNRRSMQIFVAILTVVLIAYYYYTCLGVTIAYDVDNYLNYRFMWSVK